MQAPTRVTFGWRAACQGNQVRFARAIEQAGLAPVLLFALHGGQQAAFGKALADTADGLVVGFDLGGDLGIGPEAAVFLIDIGQQQDTSAFSFQVRAMMGLAPNAQLLTFGFGQAHIFCGA